MMKELGYKSLKHWVMKVPTPEPVPPATLIMVKIPARRSHRSISIRTRSSTASSWHGPWTQNLQRTTINSHKTNTHLKLKPRADLLTHLPSCFQSPASGRNVLCLHISIFQILKPWILLERSLWAPYQQVLTAPQVLLDINMKKLLNIKYYSGISKSEWVEPTSSRSLIKEPLITALLVLLSVWSTGIIAYDTKELVSNLIPTLTQL